MPSEAFVSAGDSWLGANAARMDAPDLQAGPPRRWSDEVEGIRWLPRLIDKTRAAIAGTLGSYLYGQSPIDREFLRALGLGHRAFAQIVRDASDDAAVVRALAARDAEGLERARAWGASLQRRHPVWMLGLDLDDGRLPRYAWLKPIANVGSDALTAMVKRVRPSHAVDGAESR